MAQLIKFNVLNDIEKQLWDEFYKIYINCGEPFELIDGEILESISQQQINFIDESILKNNITKVVSIIGLQSSGKSTMLNHLLRTKFISSAGRCTQGCYSSILNIDKELSKQLFQYEKQDTVQGDVKLIVIDTEGFGSLERKKITSKEFMSRFIIDYLKIQKFREFEEKDYSKRFQFDIFIASLCFSISDISIINIKGDNISNELNEILQQSIVTQQVFKSKTHTKPKLMLLLNQVADSSSQNFQRIGKQSIENLIDKQHIEKTYFYMTGKLLNLKEENTIDIDDNLVNVAPSAFKTSDTKYDRSIYKSCVCNLSVLDRGYLDRVANLFKENMNTIQKSLYQKSHQCEEKWIIRFQETFKHYQNNLDQLIYSNSREVIIVDLLTKIQQNILDPIQKGFTIEMDDLEKRIKNNEQELKNHDKDSLYSIVKQKIVTKRDDIKQLWENEIQDKKKNKEIDEKLDSYLINLHYDKNKNNFESFTSARLNQFINKILQVKQENELIKVQGKLTQDIRNYFKTLFNNDTNLSWEQALQQLKPLVNKFHNQNQIQKELLSFEYTYINLRERMMQIDFFAKYSAQKIDNNCQFHKLFSAKKQFFNKYTTWNFENVQKSQLDYFFNDIQGELQAIVMKSIKSNIFQYENKFSSKGDKTIDQLIECCKVADEKNKYFNIQNYVQISKASIWDNIKKLSLNQYKIEYANKEIEKNPMIKYLIGKGEKSQQAEFQLQTGLGYFKIEQKLVGNIEKIVEQFLFNQVNSAKLYQLQCGELGKNLLFEISKEVDQYDNGIASASLKLIRYDSLKNIITSIFKYLSFIIIKKEFEEISQNLAKQNQLIQQYENNLINEAYNYYKFIKNQYDKDQSIESAEQTVQKFFNKIQQDQNKDVEEINHLFLQTFNNIDSKYYANELQKLFQNPQNVPNEKLVLCCLKQLDYRNQWIKDKFNELVFEKMQQKKNKIKQNIQQQIQLILDAFQQFYDGYLKNDYQKKDLFVNNCINIKYDNGTDYNNKQTMSGILFIKSYFLNELKNGCFYENFSLYPSQKILPQKSQTKQLSEQQFKNFIDEEGIFINHIGYYVHKLIEELQKEVNKPQLANQIFQNVEKSFQNNEQKLLSNIRSNLCSFQCFSCKKYCDQIGNHEIHECQTGHFFIGFLGYHWVKRNEGKDIALCTCEENELESIEYGKVTYNKQSWEEHKQSKQMGKWIIKTNIPQLREQQRKLWLKVGKDICKQLNLHYNENFGN